jgi:murein DD-endopeptidase MepM/ murein hydrolase activator NlpD
MDGIKENIPGSGPTNPTSKTISGNYIILKLKNGNYAFYAHLIAGSLNVKVGDKVYAGDKIARLGNSGNSSMPHLHFQISTKPLPVGDGKDPIPINAQGLPWELNKFTLYDYIPEGKSTIDEVPLSVNITNKHNINNQILMYQNLIDFV